MKPYLKSLFFVFLTGLPMGQHLDITGLSTLQATPKPKNLNH